MKKIFFTTSIKPMLADVYTPVGVYLRLRDRFRDTILLESTDSHGAENSFSFIAVNAIAGIEITAPGQVEFKLPQQEAQKMLNAGNTIADTMQTFMDHFVPNAAANKLATLAQALYGYTSYDAIPQFEKIVFKKTTPAGERVPLLRYRLYQYLIIFNHYKDEMYLCENHFDGIDSNGSDVESLMKGKDVPVFPFRTVGTETNNMTDDDYKKIVTQGIQSCKRGDVFQLVLSRRFHQEFQGDEFNVYRCLRSINPSPYLFYFDYGDYRLMGSSPESQLRISNGTATIHPIAGTYKRTGNDEHDQELAKQLEADPKENAEHVMLVDLARNDLSTVCSNVRVSSFKKIQFYSHVIHMVSEVQGQVVPGENPFKVLGKCFPAGTLSGAPKYKAMQLIDQFETVARGFYGGAIGMLGFNGDFNHAIIIRSMLSKNNTLHYQAGAGITVNSVPENELQEVNNKLGALKNAISMAQNI